MLGGVQRGLLRRRVVGIGSAVGQVLGPHAGGVLWKRNRE